jgi:hypothetical protein
MTESRSMKKFCIHVLGNAVALFAYVWIMGNLITQQSLPFLGQVPKEDLDPSHWIRVGCFPLLLILVAWMLGNVIGWISFMLWEFLVFAVKAAERKNQLGPIK